MLKTAIVLTLLLTGCDKEAAEQKPVPITVKYPADYFTVLPEPPKPPVVVVEKEVEKRAEEKAKRIIAAERAKEKQAEQKKEELLDKQALLKARFALKRAARTAAGGVFLNGAREEAKTERRETASVQPPPRDKAYAAPNITSSYPVDRSFILTEDRTIPAVLLDGINTQIAGTVRAYVSEDVFGASGRFKLLEKGDVVIGKYQPTKKVGDTRVEIAFHRIIRAADGAEVYSSGAAFAYAADKMGRTGLVGDVDNRNWERYGLAFSTSLIGGIAGLGKAKVDGDEYEEFWNRLSDNTTEITTKILEQTMSIAPVITIAQGEPILIRLASDITLKRER